MKRSVRPSAFSLPLLGALLVAGCGANDLTLHYKLDGITPADVVRVETRVLIDPADTRNFYVDQPFRQVATGVGYEVRDVDGTGRRTLLVTHDATLGYVFAPTFDFRLLPPVNGTAPPLSINARAVGVTDMIGQTMPLAATFNKGAKLDVDLTDQRCGAQSCDANQACCGGACTAVQSDAANCGGCGVACASSGDSCSGATCRCAGGSACSAGSTCCAGLGCIDLQNDPFHCGACGHACNPGETCSAGQCACGSGAACTGANAICCGGGTCSLNGSCMCSGGAVCNFPGVCCGPACIDPKTDNNNCGSCGHHCTAPLACMGGACACNGTICAGGDTCCSTGCANTTNDPENCGMCGRRCRTGEVCSGGQCLCGSSTCAPMQLCCGASCVTQSATNCGACNHVCKMGESCASGSCSCNGGPNCTGNQVCCPGGATGGSGGCFDPSNDPRHCGDCATQCPNGDACVLGHCVATPCNPPCTNGNSCVGGECRCNGGGACGNDQTCCADGCKNLASDPQNCNACGKTCKSGDYCCKGVCTPPDDNNCTGCGQACGGLQTCCACPGKQPMCATAACLCL
ncbi:MAG: hypothetical protein ACXVCV_10685 [Polyangia bacterium]